MISNMHFLQAEENKRFIASRRCSLKSYRKVYIFAIRIHKRNNIQLEKEKKNEAKAKWRRRKRETIRTESKYKYPSENNSNKRKRAENLKKVKESKKIYIWTKKCILNVLMMAFSSFSFFVFKRRGKMTTTTTLLISILVLVMHSLYVHQCAYNFFPSLSPSSSMWHLKCNDAAMFLKY